MPNTTNFNWATPADTDLVKDGAAAIRTLGSSIDTSFVDLKGGTTGQVLSKASNTDLDYSWVTTDDANAIQNAIVDAKGDLISATGNDTPARLAVGNNGETLVADSAATTGLRWSSTPAASNPVINGAFDIWQRGTSFSLAASTAAANGFLADRWQTATSTNQACTISRQSVGDTTNLPSIQYCLRYQRNSGQTGTGGLELTNAFETSNSIPFAGKTVTLSFYARAGTNYSPTSSLLAVYLITGTGTDQSIWGAGFTGTATPINTTATLTTTWQRFSFSGTVAATATQMGVDFRMNPTGTASTNDYYEITGVQIDVGSVALPFRRAQNTLAGELAACQRYFELATITTSRSGYVGYSQATTASTVALPSIQKRTTPTITVGGAGTLKVLAGGGSEYTVTSVTSITQQSNCTTGQFNVASGLTAGSANTLYANGGDVTLSISAEL